MDGLLLVALAVFGGFGGSPSTRTKTRYWVSGAAPPLLAVRGSFYFVNVHGE